MNPHSLPKTVSPVAMPTTVLQLNPKDNLLVALRDLQQGETILHGDKVYNLATEVPAKHKFSMNELAIGDPVVMYGVKVGTVVVPIRKGEAITTRNIKHDAFEFHDIWQPFTWDPPDVSRWRNQTFLGYSRSDGRVGTRNYWLVIPLVFCENRNLMALKQAFEEELGFVAPQLYRRHVNSLIRLLQQGDIESIRNFEFCGTAQTLPHDAQVFPNVDGIKFLIHEGGCGGTREDSQNLCGLLAGYLHHPNVAGATVLSLGCQHAQVSILEDELDKRAPQFDKPLFIFEQQKFPSENKMLSHAIRETFLGLIEANCATRQPAPLSSLCVGLKCGGSDGFSGLSANPAIGHVSDILAAVGGRTILSEFPELCGVEQELIDRCASEDVAHRFAQLMRDYAARAKAVRSGFDMNPSPGNIRDGLVTDAMKSAGAARKGGSSPVTAALDYPEYSRVPGLNLQCTPGNDVECVTAQVGAGANIVLFTTGLGTPTGNPIAPVIKISTNSQLALRMSDIIDVDTGGVISGSESFESAGDEVLVFALQVASGTVRTKAEILGQNDFIPWKRGVSL
jgi:altronate hydrolase